MSVWLSGLSDYLDRSGNLKSSRVLRLFLDLLTFPTLLLRPHRLGARRCRFTLHQFRPLQSPLLQIRRAGFAVFGAAEVRLRCRLLINVSLNTGVHLHHCSSHLFFNFSSSLAGKDKTKLTLQVSGPMFIMVLNADSSSRHPSVTRTEFFFQFFIDRKWYFLYFTQASLRQFVLLF